MLFTLGLLFASRRLTCWAVVAAALCQLTVVADDKVLISERIDGVINGAARLGVPVLAVASTDSCRDGPVLKRRLANNPSLQPLVARFAIVELRMSGNDKWEWSRWQGHFDIRRRNTPQLFVIRADGRVSFSGDPPAELAGSFARSSTPAGSRLRRGRPTSSKPDCGRRRSSRRRGIWSGRWEP
jgi:hypothetical protein